MKTYLTFRTGATTIAFGVVAALSFSGVAQAITDTVFRYSTPRTGYYSIGHLALNPLGSAYATSYFRDFDGGLNSAGQMTVSEPG